MQRHHMTLREKAAIQTKMAENPKWTREELRQWASDEFKLPKVPSKTRFALMNWVATRPMRI
jgi:hypothetical protein